MLNTLQVLHPGNCKQSVPPALAIFDETTSAAIESYFPDRTDASGFLGLVHSWWIISNSKRKFNTRNKLGNAATKGDSKTSFFRAFADWLTMWQTEKLPNCEKFQLSQQTNSALIWFKII